MNDNIAIGIMTSINLKDRYMACKNTWTKDFDNVYFFGGDSLDNNLIRLKNVGEDYSSAFMKQQLGLKYMFEQNKNFDWFSMNGCDHILFKRKVVDSLKKFDRNNDIIIGQTNNRMIVYQTNILTIAGGASYFISNSLMRKIYPLIDAFNDYWLKLSINHKLPVPYGCADVAITYMIKLYFNIEPIHLSGMYSQKPEYYSEKNHFGYLTDENDITNLNNPISFHYIKPKEMEEVYEKYK